MGHNTKQVNKHCGMAAHRMQRTLDALLAVVTIDTLINIGVLVTGVVLMAHDLGWFATGESERPPVVVVRTNTSADSGTNTHN